MIEMDRVYSMNTEEGQLVQLGKVGRRKIVEDDVYIVS